MVKEKRTEVKVVVLGGGNSPERAVSLRSSKAVASALILAGYEVTTLDPEDMSVLDLIEPGTIVIPMLHGKNGEDGIIQAELEKRKLPFLGSSSSSSRICFDKWLTRQNLKKTNIPFSKAELVKIDGYEKSELIKKPHVLKVRRGGSSIGVLIVRNVSKLKLDQVDDVFSMGDEALIEELIEGIEITVPVLDRKALPVIEIKPPSGVEFDYENKYNGEVLEICPPKSVSIAAQRLAQRYAEEAHELLGCRHMSRSDFIVTEEGQVKMLEINTIPGMTSQSLYPLAAKKVGLDMTKLVARFLKMIERDYKL